MKKGQLLRVSLMLLMSLGLMNIQAKDDESDETMGIRLGLNNASMYIDSDKLAGIDNSNSFYAGLYREKKILPFARFGLGIEYNQNGYKVDDINSRTMHYVSIPAYLKIKMGPTYLLGGASMKAKVNESLSSIASHPLLDTDSEILDIPIQVGFGVKVFHFNVEARYYIGMLDINNSASNRYFQVGISAAIPSKW